MLDRHNLFETTLAEFLSILYLPMEKSFNVLQEKLKQRTEGNIPLDVKESYAMWLKNPGRPLHEPVQVKEYTDALHRTLNKLEDFLIAKDEAIRDFLQLLPVVTQQDMDEMYRSFT